ncbi:hypothetical protein Adt_18846 [Abeliophyllum distichum]|uniref:Uncharacterized protein n=1 Tax=Abeliophyllum distichum TaxID=126358 RepID=A0ABD1TKL7_9LAMI
MKRKKRNGSQHSSISHPNTNEEEEEPPPKKQKQLLDLPKPEHLENEIAKILSAMESSTLQAQNGKVIVVNNHKFTLFEQNGKATKNCFHGRWLIVAAILPSTNLNRHCYVSFRAHKIDLLL